MQLPAIVRRIGRTEGEDRIYIEDYVYTYLNEVRDRSSFLPVRAALFGHACGGENGKIYLIYGAACVVEELEKGRTTEKIRQKYFDGYELVGYVNIYRNQGALSDRQKGWPPGCCIFYDANESMQNYLISLYKQTDPKTGKQEEPEEKSFFKESGEKQRKSGFECIWELLFYSICVVLMAIAVTTINEYSQMYGFMEEAVRAAAIME